MKKHLTYADRIEIQAGIERGKNFSQIARILEKSRTTISREIASRAMDQLSRSNTCVKQKECTFPAACSRHNCLNRSSCHRACKECQRTCANYEEDRCLKLLAPPYVCNPCDAFRSCRRNKKYYDAKRAHNKYRKQLSEARTGISITEEDVAFLEETIAGPARRGLSIPISYERNKDQMPVSLKTLYTYIDGHLLNMSNLELRRKVQRKQVKKRGPALKVDKGCQIGRCYEDYLSFMEAEPDVNICQMDTVEGRKGGKVLLTLFFKSCDLQLLYIRERNTAASVSEIFETLRNVLGRDHFKTLFQVILTDRGSEFTDPKAIEVDPATGASLCKVFYCDPMASNQKSNCERNHELVRYVFPKGHSLDSFTQEDINKASSHINSYPRKKWNYKSPLDLFIDLYGKEVTTLLGLETIDFRSITLSRALFDR